MVKLDIYSKCLNYFKIHDVHVFNEIDFWRICPIPSEIIQSKIRDAEVVKWRHVGCVWMMFTANSVTQAAQLIHRNHATVIHATKKVVNAIDGYDEELLEVLEILVDSSRKGLYMNYVDKHYNDDVKENELVGLATLQSNYNALKS